MQQELHLRLPQLPKTSLLGTYYENVDCTPVVWKRNVLTKTIKKKQKRRSSIETRIVETEIETDSFFHYFEINNGQHEMDTEITEALRQVIPNMDAWMDQAEVASLEDMIKQFEVE